LRTVYLGTSAFAAAVLERLADSPHRPALVVTRPDRPAGRGRKLTAPPVAETARALGLEVHQPANVNEDPRIGEVRPDAVLVCAFGAILREPLLSAYEMLNVHPSLLPRWRGAAPVERAIMAGDEETGVAIMRPTAELDAGPVFLMEREPIRPDDDYGTLAERLQRLGGDLLVRALDEQPAPAEQPAEGVTYAEKITAEDRVLDGTQRTAAELDRIVRALHPHIGARAGDLRVLRAEVVADGPAAGELDDRLVLGTREGGLRLLEVQPPGKRPMEAGAYLRGHRLGT
jgi:methionyl-tRNA formyltransferase